MKREKCSKNFKSGFTLLELMVVVLIIGVLAAVALPQYQKVVEKSKYAEAEKMLQTLAQAQQRYILSNTLYTTTFDELDIDFPNVSQNSSIFTTKNFELSLEIAMPNGMVLAKRKKGNNYIYSIYKDIRTGKMYCEDLDTTDKIDCNMFFGYTCWDRSKSTNGSISGCKPNSCPGDTILPEHPGGVVLCTNIPLY